MLADFAINSTKIIYEVLNTEVIVINFSTGDYYELPHVAKHVWQSLEQHLSTANIIQLLSNFFKKDPEQVKMDVENFVTQLLEHGLIIESDNSATLSVEDLENIIGQDCRHWEYDKPAVNKYSEVQNLLLLDPIHDVDETGWPNIPQEQLC